MFERCQFACVELAGSKGNKLISVISSDFYSDFSYRNQFFPLFEYANKNALIPSLEKTYYINFFRTTQQRLQ